MPATWAEACLIHVGSQRLTAALIARVAPFAGPTPGKAGPLSPLTDGLLSRVSAKPPANLPPEPSAGCSKHQVSVRAPTHDQAAYSLSAAIPHARLPTDTDRIGLRTDHLASQCDMQLALQHHQAMQCYACSNPITTSTAAHAPNMRKTLQDVPMMAHAWIGCPPWRPARQGRPRARPGHRPGGRAAGRAPPQP